MKKVSYLHYHLCGPPF